MPTPQQTTTSTIPIRSIRDWTPGKVTEKAIGLISEVPLTNLAERFQAQQLPQGPRR